MSAITNLASRTPRSTRRVATTARAVTRRRPTPHGRPPRWLWHGLLGAAAVAAAIYCYGLYRGHLTVRIRSGTWDVEISTTHEVETGLGARVQRTPTPPVGKPAVGAGKG